MTAVATPDAARLVFAAVAGLILLLILIIKFKVHAMISILIGAVGIGLMAGMPLSDIIGSVNEGIGNTLKGIALLVGLGSMFGAILEESGGAQTLAVTMVRKFGDEKAAWALGITGLVVAGYLEFPVNSLVTVLGVIGVALSLSLQGSLSKLAGGIMVRGSRPFAVGDYVEADGVGGTVISIGLAYSTLATVDNKEIFIPNSQVAAAKIINYTKLGKRRVELTFSASYDAPTETVKQALGEVLAQFPQILEDPAPSIWISKYGASSIEYVVRVWTAAGDYWDVYYGVMEGVRPAFQRHGIQMTYDHLNVHLLEK